MPLAALRRFWHRVRHLGRPAAAPGELEAEIATHLELLTERYVRQGLDPAAARLAARRQFGSTALLQDRHQALVTFSPVDAVHRSLRSALRQLRVGPGFAAVAMLSIALGLGANAAVFTLLDQLVLRLLPVPEPERLVMIWATGPSFGDTRGVRVSSYPLCRDYQRFGLAVEHVVCRWATTTAVTVDGRTEPVRAELVSGNYFQGLGVGAAAGRVLIADADDRPDSPHVVLVSHRYWIDRLGARADIAGTKILVNGLPMEIVGVAAAGFTGIDPAEAPQIWLPLRVKPLVSDENGLEDRTYHFVHVFGRLAPGYTAEGAEAALQPFFRRTLEEEVGLPGLARLSEHDRQRYRARTVRLTAAGNGYSELRERYAPALGVLMGIAGLILLVACTNVANLLTARAVARRREIAVRLSLGASRATLIAHLLTESLVLAVSGLALGLALATVTTRLLLGMLPPSPALLMLKPEPDARVLVFGGGLTLVTVLLFGLAPALQATRLDVFATLKSVAGGLAGAAGAARLRKVLVAGQVTLSFLLLVAAGLFTRTLLNLRDLGTGIPEMAQVASFTVDPARLGYDAMRTRRLYESVLRDLRALPEVSAAATAWIPLFQGWAPSWNMRVEGHTTSDGEDMEIQSNVVSPDYWRTMRVPLLTGRVLDAGDRFEAAPPQVLPTRAVVNRSFARRFFGTASPIGRHLGIGDQKDALGIEIVGVVEDAVYAGPREGRRPMAYLPLLQTNAPVAATFYVRTHGSEPARLFHTLRKIVARHDPTLPVTDMKTLDRQLDDVLSTERLVAALSVAFGGLATIVAALGLFGVMAFTVARRSKEIGLRMALGARPASVAWLIGREVLTLVGCGLAAGVPIAWLGSRLVSSLLFGVRPGDAATFAAAVAVLAGVAGLSLAVAARRVTAIDPLDALRID